MKKQLKTTITSTILFYGVLPILAIMGALEGKIWAAIIVKLYICFHILMLTISSILFWYANLHSLLPSEQLWDQFLERANEVEQRSNFWRIMWQLSLLFIFALGDWWNFAHIMIISMILTIYLVNEIQFKAHLIRKKKIGEE